MKSICFFFFTVLFSFSFADYPAHWWQVVSEEQRKGSWEILPQEAKVGEVILSKRNELGLFSNLGHTPFFYDGEFYESVEGLWQSMKYPEDKTDPRFSFEYPYSRDEVKLLFGFTSKKAGDTANKIMKENNIDWISYNKVKFNYKDMNCGSSYHYKIISEAIKEKIIQNPELKELLLSTKGLTLMPDHNIRKTKPASYFYNEILMLIRENL